ncbi:putative lipid II flippase FtsW [Salinisphaera sp. USBA-960]|nr:putative lipid II flippase FtsW [Salifodinibacter halophilus]NNC26759.1 putative lipid II flippase FtsW [Salifodinibacter halophilus]
MADSLQAWRLRGTPDRLLVGALVVIALLGLVMVASASTAVAARQTGDALHYFYRQSFYLALGIAFGGAVFMVPMRTWAARPFVLLALGIGLLIVVLLPGVGHSVNGARRWIDLGLISIQASEPARLLLILYLAGYAARRRRSLVETWGGLLRPLVFVVLAGGLLLLEPNFGALVVLGAIAGLMFFVAGARLLHLLVVGAVGASAMAAIMVSSPYRLERIISFVHPWANAQDTGFQLTQSLMAIGHGKLFGVGLGNSVQKLMYLPETHTDFLFAVYADEFGLLGTLALLGLYLIVVWRGFAIARRALDSGAWFAGFAAYGLVSWLGVQAFINIGVNMGLLPTKGLTLPLMSYGGSSLITVCAVCALIFRIDVETQSGTSEASS